jgi:hypothetical protein
VAISANYFWSFSPNIARFRIVQNVVAVINVAVVINVAAVINVAVAVRIRKRRPSELF